MPSACSLQKPNTGIEIGEHIVAINYVSLSRRFLDGSSSDFEEEAAIGFSIP